MYKNIPQEMKEAKRWVNWKYQEDKKGRLTKIPKNSITGGNASSVNSNTWVDYETAVKQAPNHSGIGFMLGDGWVGVDIDNKDKEVQDYKAGIKDNVINEFIETLGSYAEYSPSGNGIHIIGKGTIPEGKNRRGDFEFYQNGRYFTVTGDIAGEETKVNEFTENVTKLHRKYLKTGDTPEQKRVKQNTQLDLSESEIIEKAINSKNGTKFNDLFNGMWENYFSSQSEADLGFCNYLAFWSNRDYHNIDAIFRNSGLYRDKWDSKRGQATYGEYTINRAIDDCIEVYKPKYNINLEQKNSTSGRDTERAKDKASTNNYTIKEEKYPRFRLTDTGNAERLVYHYGDILKYHIESKKWIIWNGKNWNETEGLEAERLTKEIARNIYIESKIHATEETEKEYVKFQAKTESKRSRKDMLELARSEEGISINSNQLDKQVNYLNCKNGTINLKNGELKDHKKEDLITKYINVEYNPEVKAIRWEQFLKEIMNNDLEMINFLQRAIGYSLTGETREQVMFIPYGMGSNGKSLFLDTISHILGLDYSTTIQAESLGAVRDGKEASPDIMDLQGKRLVTSSETQQGKGLNEALIKQVTGEAQIKGRKLYSEPIVFNPEFKIWLATNHKPDIKGTDDGIWRRLLLIPFTQKFYENHEGKKPLKDKELQEKLYQELEGVFSWAVEGAIKWYKDGLQVPDKVRKATEKYREGEDLLQDFINNKCIENVNSTSLFKDLFKDYNFYCYEVNEKQATKKEFRSLLEFKNIRVDYGTGNQLTVYGIGLLTR